MDQLKTQLAVVGKHGFWIASVLVLLVSLGVWYLSTAALVKLRTSQTTKITGAYTQVSNVREELPKIPNDLSHEEMNELITDRQGEVLKSWKQLYDRQENILVWPQETFNQEFLNEFVGKVPIENFVEFPTEESDELETTLRKQYKNYIYKQLPKLAGVADAEWTAAFDQSNAMDMLGGMGGGQSRSGVGAGGTAEGVGITGVTKESLVKWSDASQAALLGDLFPWRGGTPSTLEIYYSQENLWILRQLLEIIREVNGDAEQPYQAKIHEIAQIAIGKSVSTTPGNISKPGQSASAGGGDMDMGGMDMDMDMGGMGMDMGDMGGMGSMGGASVSSDPAENRYHNAANEPIAGSTLRAALTSNSPNDAPLAVAKRVPVMMKLNMNQRAVHELVAVCGSADLMVEVHQVRVLPQSASSGGMGGMDGEGMEGEGEMDMGGDTGMGGGGPGMGGGPGGMEGGSSGGAADDSDFPLDMSVEVYGIIYIYNPPDPVKLGVEQVTENTVLDVNPGTIVEQKTDSTPLITTPPAGGGTTPPVATGGSGTGTTLPVTPS